MHLVNFMPQILIGQQQSPVIREHLWTASLTWVLGQPFLVTEIVQGPLFLPKALFIASEVSATA